MPNNVMTIRVSDELLNEIDERWKEMGFNNRAEYIRYKLKNGLNTSDIRKKVERLRKDGKEMIDEGNKMLKEAEYLEAQLENGYGDVNEIRDDLIEMILRKYREWGGRVYSNKKYPFVITEIPNSFDQNFEWTDEDEAANILELNKPEIGVGGDKWVEHAEKTVQEWIDKNMIIYGKNG